MIGIDATNPADPVIGPGTTIYLNTDQNTATGFSPTFAPGAVGADYEVQFHYGSNSALEPFLYSISSDGRRAHWSTAAPRSTTACPATARASSYAIPQSLLTPSGGTAPTSIDFSALINNADGSADRSGQQSGNITSSTPRRS